MTDDPYLPTPSEIIEIHEEIERAYGLDHRGVSAHFPEETLGSVLSDVRDHDDVYCRAAELLRGVISAHVFADGNKRTAWTVTRLYLDDHDAGIIVEDTEHIESVLKRVRRFDTDEIADWLSNGDIDGDRLLP